MLRAGNAGSNTASDHIQATRLALAQLPCHLRRRVLIRSDSGGGTHEFRPGPPGQDGAWPTPSGSPSPDIADAILKIPPAPGPRLYDAEGRVRPGAWVAEITGMLDFSGWPPGMRVIVRKERPHPGAQLRFTDIDGQRFTCFATSTKGGQLADLELRHRHRAGCEDRIGCAKDTGLRNPPLHGYAQNQIWCEIVGLACELLAWTQMLSLTGQARRWGTQTAAAVDLSHVPGRIVRGGRRLRLRLAVSWLWTAPTTTAITRLQAWHPADQPKPSLRPGRTPAGTWNPTHPARQPGRRADRPPKTGHKPQPQATQPRSRKMQARAAQ